MKESALRQHSEISMTRQHILKTKRKTRALSAVVLFLAALTVLLAFAAPASQTGADTRSAQSSVASIRAVSRLRKGRYTALATAADNSVSFSPAVTYGSGGVDAWSVAVSDVNGDGKPDVAVANEGDNTVGGLLGNGDGTFQPAGTYGSGGVFAFLVPGNSWTHGCRTAPSCAHS